MSRRRNQAVQSLLAAAIGLGAAGLASAQPAPVPVKPNKVRPEVQMGTSEILQKIASDDAAVRQQGLEHVKERLAVQPSRVVDLRSQIFKTLIAAKHYDEAIDLAQHAIFAQPQDTRLVEGFQAGRVKALLAAGKTEDALQNAKSLFNVCTMTGTSDAILSVAECLNAARPKDRDIFNRFREEQMAGAATQPSVNTPASVSANKGARSTVLDSIKVDARLYDDALAKMPGEDYASLMARGNLLLMADRPKEAREVFGRMYSLAGSTELVEASEALARCIRAEDGTIGRANTWVQAIKPKKESAPATPAATPAAAPAAPAKQ